MNKKEQSRQTFDLQASKYDTTFYGKHARNIYPYLLNDIIRCYGEEVLDLGCGTGALMKQVISEDSHRHLTGIDLSSQMIEKAKHQLKNKATLVVGDSENLPFFDQTFDIVYCNDSFHHYPNPQKAIAEIYRVLKIGGTLIIGDTYLPVIARQVMNYFIRFNKDGDVRIYSKKEMISFLEELFHEIKWIKVSNSAYMIKGVK